MNAKWIAPSSAMFSPRTATEIWPARDEQFERFASSSPLGLVAGPNPFEYCGNDPTNDIDPSGLGGPGDGGEGPLNFPRDPSDWGRYHPRRSPSLGGATGGYGGEASGGNPEDTRAFYGWLGGILDSARDLDFMLSMQKYGGCRTLPEKAGAVPLVITPKILRQMLKRGWTPQKINEATFSADRTPAINRSNGNPATRYVSPTTGQSVVIDNVTGDIIHVGQSGFGYSIESGDVPLIEGPAVRPPPP